MFGEMRRIKKRELREKKSEEVDLKKIIKEEKNDFKTTKNEDIEIIKKRIRDVIKLYDVSKIADNNIKTIFPLINIYKKNTLEIINEFKYDINIIEKICSIHKKQKGYIRRYDVMISFFEQIQKVINNLRDEEKREYDWVQRLENFEKNVIDAFNQLNIPEDDENLEYYKDIYPLAKHINNYKVIIFRYLECIKGHTGLAIKTSIKANKKYFIIKKTLEKYLPLLKNPEDRKIFYQKLRNSPKDKHKNINHILKKFCRQENGFFDELHKAEKIMKICLDEMTAINDIEETFSNLVEFIHKEFENFDKTKRIYEQKGYM